MSQRPPPFYPFHPTWEGAFISHEQWHFHRRLFERYSVVLRPGEYSRLFKKAVIEKKKHVCDVGKCRIHAVFLHSVQEIVFVIANDVSLITAITPAHARKRKRVAKMWVSESI